MLAHPFAAAGVEAWGTIFRYRHFCKHAEPTIGRANSGHIYPKIYEIYTNLDGLWIYILHNLRSAALFIVSARLERYRENRRDQSYEILLGQDKPLCQAGRNRNIDFTIMIFGVNW